ncbi:MAG: dimethylsulfonioproprionate lyase family protein [Granulosicoccus sp.]
MATRDDAKIATESENSSLHAFMRAAGNRFAIHDSDIARKVAHVLANSSCYVPASTDVVGINGFENLSSSSDGCQDVSDYSYIQQPSVTAMESLIARLARYDDNLLELLSECVADLCWRQAGFGKLPLSVRNKIFVVELIGPTGMYQYSEVRCGLLFQCEHVNYPWHKHAAEELYLIIDGHAGWAVNDALPTVKERGTFVHHKSMQPHSMETGANSLLALWGWTGDVNGDSYAL